MSLGTVASLAGLVIIFTGFLLPGDLIVTTAPLTGPVYEARFEQLRLAWILIGVVMVAVGLWYRTRRK